MEQSREATVGPRPPWAGQGDLNNVYGEICANIRATDDVSLKLLAAVPLVTGVGIVLLLRAPNAEIPHAAIMLLSLLAAIVTFAVYRWECKNMENCRHFRRWAAILERDFYGIRPGELRPAPDVLPHGQIVPPRQFGVAWTKTEALQFLYWAAIGGWLVTGTYAVAT
ncbi:hypothetical protein [Plantactinospora sp. KBS50]|uniref:hypothetical protein n=1 Tax=Plantactinospora sp. KBS50 TaxID=2024580 RepID=UPI000BAADF21|nr:hypothetical protein [Plantactinospora sp. KBS50]ASW53801.1 hypothetical protein CIK06_05770 [Plantactinospora sp. KBS50]